MNSILRDVIHKTNSKIKKYELKDKAIIYTDYYDNKYVAKKYNNNLPYIYDFLKTRNFIYMPDISFYDNGYVYRYIDNYAIPNDKKMYDIIKITALLHSKTVYFKEVSTDYIKSIYEELLNKIDNVFKYYDDIINSIEYNEFISPSGYLLLRNCSILYSCISFCKNSIESWYNSIKEKNKIRMVVVHNNLNTDHVVEGNDKVLISWDNSKIDMPIYDLIRLYKQTYNKYDFTSLYNEYKKIFGLTNDEEKLLYTILFIPDIINFDESEFNITKKLSELFNYLLTTNNLFMKNQAKNTEEKNNNINKENESMESNT